jgi:hypothetical protein
MRKSTLPQIPAAFRAAAIHLLLAGAACGDAGREGRPEHPERLDGAWTVEFGLEHSATLTRDTAGLAPVRGAVVLVQNVERRGVHGLSGVPTHYGVYQADLRPIGLSGGRGVPTLVVRLVGTDSVEIAFDPRQGSAFTGRGTLAGDSVRGHWRTTDARSTGRSSGRFVMRRR